MRLGTLEHVFGVTCSDRECAYHDSLHTANQKAATRTARELGWRRVDGQWYCPMCAASLNRHGNGHGHESGHAARKGVRV